MNTYKFLIKGITCSSCVNKIETTLKSTNEFHFVQVLRGPDRVEIDTQQTVFSSDINNLFKKFQLNKYEAFQFDPHPPDMDSDILLKASNGKNLIQGNALYQQLYPLFLVISYLVGTVLTIAVLNQDFSLHSLMSHYMGGFFLIFSFFKFLNINGFADAFQTYDPIAKRWRSYGYIYASFELVAGIGYLAAPHSVLLNSLVLIVLGISSWGVTQAVLNNKSIQCACLGTLFNLPMTKVTIIENASMILMALFMIM